MDGKGLLIAAAGGRCLHVRHSAIQPRAPAIEVDERHGDREVRCRLWPARPVGWSSKVRLPLVAPRSQTPVWERPPRNSVSCLPLVPKVLFGNALLETPFRVITVPMTRTRNRIFEAEYPYFLTCTVVGWVPVFTRPEAVQILFDCWAYMRQNRNFKLYGYVVLENHLHLIAPPPSLSNAMKSSKMYTAGQVIELLTRHGAEMLLRQLRALKLRHKTMLECQVCQEGNHPKQVRNEEMMRQKLEYLANNPVKRGAGDDPVHWRYFSARDYAGLPALGGVVTDVGGGGETGGSRRAVSEARL